MISVIIPCYNSAKYINRAVESVFNQTYSDFEMILVDNNSSDNTLDILYEYKNKHPEIITVLQELKQGSPAARNKGLSQAKGEWIQFLDADDELLPGKLATQLALAEKSAIDVVVGSCSRFKTFVNGEIREIPRRIETDVWRGLLTSRLGITSANLWRRKTLLEVNGWSESVSSSQEYDLLFRLLKNNAVVEFCPLVQTIVHITENSITSSQNEDRIIEIINNSIKLRIEIKEYLKSQGKLTKKLARHADLYNYTTLVMRSYRPLVPLYFRKGKIPDFVKKALKQYQFDVPLFAVIKLHAGRIYNILRQKVKYLMTSS